MGYLNDLADKIAFANNEKGFSFEEKDIERKLLLAVSEICEAQEELRDGHSVTEIYYSVHVGAIENGLRKPCGFPVEIADTIIRLLHLGRNFGIDFDAVVEEKLAYNASRPMKHGRQF